MPAQTLSALHSPKSSGLAVGVSLGAALGHFEGPPPSPGDSKTPVTITPSEKTGPAVRAVGFHWVELRLSVPYSVELFQVLGKLSAWLGHAPTAELWAPAGFGRYQYGERHTGPRGVQVLSGTAADSPHCSRELRLVATGDSCECISLAEWQSLLQLVQDSGWTLYWNNGRVDLRLDVDGLPIDMVQAAGEAGDVRTHARSGRRVESSQWFGIEAGGEDGTTLYVGSRTSDRFCRIYNKRGFVRFELELSGKRAMLAFVSCLAHTVKKAGHEVVDVDTATGCIRWRSPAEFSRHVAGLIDAYVSFIDRNSDSNISRCTRVGWWDDILDGAEQVRHIIARAKATWQRMARWVDRSVAPTLAVLQDIARELGVSEAQMFGDILAGGHERMGKRHRAVFKQWQAGHEEPALPDAAQLLIASLRPG